MGKNDYLTKDYEGYRQLMLSKIPELLPEWTDHSQGDFGVVILELLAHGLDVLSLYQDKAVRERILAQAQTRKAVMEDCSMLNYELGSQTPSQYVLTVTKKQEAVGVVTLLEAGYTVGTPEDATGQIVYETMEDLIIPAGTLTGTVRVEQGITVVDELIGASTGQPSQKFKLLYPDAIKNAVSVRVVTQAVDEVWTRKEVLYDSTSEDKHFRAYYNEFNELFVEFGTGNAGAIPPQYAVLMATYRVGGGTQGNVGVNTITEFIDAKPEWAESITNASSPIVYGENVESIASAKYNAPRAYRAKERAVTKDDYVYFAKKHPSVLKARGEETFNANNEINIYIAVPDFTVPTAEVKQSVKDSIMPYNMGNIVPVIKALTVVPVNISVRVLAHDGYDAVELQTKCESILWQAYASELLEEGKELTVGDIYKTLLLIEGVRAATVVTPATDIKPASFEVLQLVSVVVQGSAE